MALNEIDYVKLTGVELDMDADRVGFNKIRSDILASYNIFEGVDIFECKDVGDVGLEVDVPFISAGRTFSRVFCLDEEEISETNWTMILSYSRSRDFETNYDIDLLPTKAFLQYLNNGQPPPDKHTIMCLYRKDGISTVDKCDLLLPDEAYIQMVIRNCLMHRFTISNLGGLCVFTTEP